MRDFVVRGYIINIDGNRLTIKVDDDKIEEIAFIATVHKKTPSLGNFINVNTRTAKFNITNLKWSELADLKGVRVEINCTTRISQFQKKTNIPNEFATDTYIPEYTITKIVSFVAKSIKNI